MMKAFRRDTVSEIRKTTEALSQISAKLVMIRDERRQALTEAEDLEVIRRLDSATADQERFAASLQERLTALDAVRRKEREADRVAEKAKAVAAFEKEYRAKRVAAAGAVIEAACALGDAWAAYSTGRNEPWSLWRNDLFPSLNDQYSPFAPIDHLLDRIAHALGMPIEGAGDRLTGIRSRTAEITADLSVSADSYLTALRESPLPAIVESEDEAAA